VSKSNINRPYHDTLDFEQEAFRKGLLTPLTTFLLEKLIHEIKGVFDIEVFDNVVSSRQKNKYLEDVQKEVVNNTHNLG
jgi:hypothetical protein